MNEIEGAEVAEKRYRNLRVWNLAVGAVLVIQGLLMLVLSSDFALPVSIRYLRMNELAGRAVPYSEELAMVRVGPIVALFLLLSGLALLIIASPGVFGWYRKNLARGANYGRWIEYSITSSLMIVVIAMLSGMDDLSSLILIFFLNMMMILFGWMMELHNQTTEKTDWTSFVFGCIAGIVPWIIIAVVFAKAAADPSNEIPTFVYYILVSLFVFFNVFAINMVLQYKRVGPWEDYLFGEKVYIILSLAAKSALAWQVFGGTLADRT